MGYTYGLLPHPLLPVEAHEAEQRIMARRTLAMGLAIGLASLVKGLQMLIIVADEHIEHGIVAHQSALTEHLIALVVSATGGQRLTATEQELGIMLHEGQQAAVRLAAAVQPVVVQPVALLSATERLRHRPA